MKNMKELGIEFWSQNLYKYSNGFKRNIEFTGNASWNSFLKGLGLLLPTFLLYQAPTIK